MLRLGKHLPRLSAGVAALPPPRPPPLGTLEVQFSHAEDARVGDLATVGQRSERLQPEVDTRFLPGKRNGLAGHLGIGERHVPAVRLPHDRNRLGRACDGPGPMDADASNPRQDERAVVQSGAVAILLEGEALEAVAALEAWKADFLPALYPAEERLIGLIQTGQHIL